MNVPKSSEFDQENGAQNRTKIGIRRKTLSLNKLALQKIKLEDNDINYVRKRICFHKCFQIVLYFTVLAKLRQLQCNPIMIRF